MSASRRVSVRTSLGFTIIELLVAMSIISTMASSIIASLGNAREKGRIGGGVKFASYDYQKLGTNIVGRWKLDETSGPTAFDSSGNAYDLTLLNGASFVPDSGPMSGRASLSLDGNNDRASRTGMTGPSIIVLTGKGATLSSWVKLSSLSGTQDIAAVYDNILLGNRIFEITLDLDNQCFRFWYTDLASNNQSTCLGSADMSANKWYQLTFVLDGTTASVYKDGHFVSSGGFLPGAQQITGNFIGSIYLGSAKSNGFFLQGNLSDLILYNEALTASEIQNIYAEGLKTHSVASADR